MHNLESLLAELRAGKSVHKAVRDLLTPLVQLIPAYAQGRAFLALADAVDLLAVDHSMPAARVPAYIQRQIRYAAKEQDEEDREIVRIPESTRRTRSKLGRHTATIRQTDDGAGPLADVLLHKDHRRYCGTPCPETEREELLSYAKTAWEKSVAVNTWRGYSDEEIAEKLDATITRIRRTITILRQRGGYSYSPVEIAS